MAHVAQYKKDKVNEFTKLIDEYPIIGVVNMQNLPTKQLQKMREKLRDKVLLRMTKRRLINISLDNAQKTNIAKLKEYLNGMPALLFTKENPFSLFSTLKKNKSKAPINAGQTAPNDIVIPAGKTNFTPGPVIGELGSFGIQTAVEDGKVAIKEDKVVAKEGEVVNAKLASLLQRLGVEPMDIGLDLVAVYENKDILTKDVLDIDEDAYKRKFESGAAMAFNLAFNAGYPTRETITLLIQKAAADSRALATEANILTDENVGTLLSKAKSEANSLKSQLDSKAPAEEPAEASTEKAKEEVKEDTEAKDTESEDSDSQSKIETSEPQAEIEEPKEEPAEEVKEEEAPAEETTKSKKDSEPQAEPETPKEETVEEKTKESKEEKAEETAEKEKVKEEAPKEEPKKESKSDSNNS